MTADLPFWFQCLQIAGRDVGGKQVQNRGTLAGNICNASPAADGVPALLALDASIEVLSPQGVRVLPLSDFILGNRKTALGDAELVSAILVPHHGQRSRSAFRKLGARRYLVVSISMVAALVDLDESGQIAQARVAVGSCSEVAQRLPILEDALKGQRIDAVDAGSISTDTLTPLAPIDDIRGSAEYRHDAALVLIKRTLQSLGMTHESAS